MLLVSFVTAQFILTNFSLSTNNKWVFVFDFRNSGHAQDLYVPVYKNALHGDINMATFN